MPEQLQQLLKLIQHKMGDTRHLSTPEPSVGNLCGHVECRTWDSDYLKISILSLTQDKAVPVRPSTAILLVIGLRLLALFVITTALRAGFVFIDDLPTLVRGCQVWTAGR